MEQLDQRLIRMSHRNFEADRGRKSFMDLPGEIRNAIYFLILFKANEEWETNINTHGKLVSGQSFYHIYTRSLLRMLAAMNKQIEQESRRFFWAHANYESCSLYRFVPALSRDSRGAFAHFGRRFDADTTALGTSYLHPFFLALPDGTNLTVLDLDMALDEIFWNAFSNVWGYLETESSLQSTTLDSMVHAVSKLPKLEKISIRGLPCRNASAWNLNNSRLAFAYTSWPAEILWV